MCNLPQLAYLLLGPLQGGKGLSDLGPLTRPPLGGPWGPLAAAVPVLMEAQGGLV